MVASRPSLAGGVRLVWWDVRASAWAGARAPGETPGAALPHVSGARRPSATGGCVTDARDLGLPAGRRAAPGTRPHVAGTRGNIIRKVVPLSRVDATATSPPWARAT